MSQTQTVVLKNKFLDGLVAAAQAYYDLAVGWNAAGGVILNGDEYVLTLHKGSAAGTFEDLATRATALEAADVLAIARMDHAVKRTAYAVDGALGILGGVHLLTKASAGAYTQAAPADSVDGPDQLILSKTAFAHVLTFAGTVRDGSATTNFNTATFAANAGAWMRIRYDNGIAYVLGSVGVTLSHV